MRFPADFSRKLDTFQTAPLQLILDGRNSNSAQIAANYLQQIVKNYQQELLEGKPKPNNSELVVRNWYNPNLDYKWFVVPSLIAMITTIGVMIVTSLSVAREREQGTLDQLLVSPLTTADLHRQSRTGVNCRHLPGHHCAGDWYLGVSNPLRRIAGAVLLYDGDLWFIAGGIRSVDFITLFNTTAGVYRRVCLYDARHSPFRLRFSGGKHAGMAANLTWINPIRHFTDITKQIYLKDASLDIVWNSLWPLLVITATTGSAAYAMFRRKVM